MQTSPHPTGRAYSESRIAVDDGYIWPFDRARMVARGPIVERMVEDIAALVTDGGAQAVVTLDDLRRKGWLAVQVENHGPDAFAAYKARKAPRRAARDGIGRLAAEAAALVLFTLPVLFWAGIATGVI